MSPPPSETRQEELRHTLESIIQDGGVSDLMDLVIALQDNPHEVYFIMEYLLAQARGNERSS